MSTAAAAAASVSSALEPADSQMSEAPSSSIPCGQPRPLTPPSASSAAIDLTSSPPSLSSSSLSLASAARLKSFLALEPVQRRYSEPAVVFTAALTEYQRAAERLTAFKTTCNSSPPSIRLPTTHALNIVGRAKLEAPAAGQPDFFNEDLKLLAEIEREATEKVYNVLVAAKERHLNMLQKLANANTFLISTLKSHSEFIRTFAVDNDKHYEAIPSSQFAALAANSSSTFPINDAIRHFELHLHSVIASVTATSVQKAAEAAAAKAATIAADHAAQETVMGGAHNGKSIALIAEQAVDRRLAQQNRSAASAHSSSSASNSSKHPSVKGKNNGNRAASSAASSSSSSHSREALHSKPQQHKRRREDSADGIRITADAGSRTVHSGNHSGQSAKKQATHPHSHPKTAQRGDRSHLTAPAASGNRRQQGNAGSSSGTGNKRHQSKNRR